MSRTRERHYARKREIRAGREYDKWWSEHHFWCKGQRRRRGKLQDCMFEVRFSAAAAGVKATCHRCKTVHIYGSPMTSNGLASERWMTVEQYQESTLPAESVQTIELSEGEREVRIVDHAAWCSDRSKALYGATAEWGGSGKIIWRMGGRFWHTCLSSQAASDLAYARWGNAR